MRGIPTGLMEVRGPGSTPVGPSPPQQIPHPAPGPRAPSAAGDAYMTQQQQPELQLRKASDSMGLSIVAARGTGQQQLGIYIKSVVKGNEYFDVILFAIVMSSL